MGIEFNAGQKMVIEDALRFYKSPSEQVFEFAGGPGTGKSVVMGEILRRLTAKYHIKIERVAPMAYTGAASIVMRMKGLMTARTIHSTLFETVEVPLIENGKVVMDTYNNTPIMHYEFRPKQLRGQLDIIMIDEAGMVPAYMLPVLLNTGAKIFACGDIDQLPPVEDTPAFLNDYSKVRLLTEIMRQAEGSAIVYLSQRAKYGQPIHVGWYGDCLVIPEDQLSTDILCQSPIVLCGRNKTRDILNNQIRSYRGFGGKFPMYGEKVLCRKNNWELEANGINLTNGLIGTVMTAPDVSSFDGKTFRMGFTPDMIEGCMFPNIAVNYQYLIAGKEQRDILRKSRYTTGNLFEFGYAETVHLSQGSQFPQGIYFEEYLNPQINNRLNYTAITRFANRMIYVKQPSKYY